MRPWTFGDVIYRILLADQLGRAALRGHFRDPNGFSPSTDAHNGSRRAITAVYRALWALEDVRPTAWDRVVEDA
jgi:hypothetical protein